MTNKKFIKETLIEWSGKTMSEGSFEYEMKRTLEQAIKQGENKILAEVGMLRQLVAEVDMTRDQIYTKLNEIAPLMSKEQMDELKTTLTGTLFGVDVFVNTNDTKKLDQIKKYLQRNK